jgi:hypothetical protein
MKNLRNIYLILGLAALAFALLTKHIPGVTVTDFVLGFCYGMSITLLLAGLVTAAIPYVYRKPKKDDVPTPPLREDDPKIEN